MDGGKCVFAVVDRNQVFLSDGSMSSLNHDGLHVDKRPKLEEASAVNDGTNDSTRQPHNILIIWGLDALTDEDKVRLSDLILRLDLIAYFPSSDMECISDVSGTTDPSTTHSGSGNSFVVWICISGVSECCRGGEGLRETQ